MMSKPEENSISVIAVTAALGAVILLITLFYNLFNSKDDLIEEGATKGDGANDKGEEVAVDNGTLATKTPAAAKKPKKEKKVVAKKAVRLYEHEWAMSCLKGHSGRITDMSFSADGTQVVTCDEDRTILLWSTKDFNSKEHRSTRSNVEFDHLTKIAFSPDGKAVIGQLSQHNTIRVFKTQKKKDTNMIVFQGATDYQKQSDKDVIDIGVSCTGRFVMACYSDTMVRVFDLKGALLDTIDTHQMTNSHGQISSCGHLIATSGFTPDVIVWEIKFDKSGGYVGFGKAFDLCGHSAGIHHFDFSTQSKRMVTISKDKKWKCWDIDIEYKQRQDPVLLQTGTYEPSTGRNMCAISPDGLTVAISTNQSVRMYDTRTATCQSVLEDVHIGGIVAMKFSFTSEVLATAGDRVVQLTRNVVGLRATLYALKQRLAKEQLSSALKNRIAEQISSIRSKLKAMNEPEVYSS